MDTGYRIGAVAKLTGISTDTIRAWERRYRLVEPNRGENNNRYYTEEHIRKLINVKRLVDAGQAIGTVCRLSAQELTDRTHGLLGAAKQPPGGPLKKWTVVSFQKPAWLQACISAQQGVEASWVSSLEQFSGDNVEFVVIDMPSLSEVNEKQLLQTIPDELAARCLVVYKFASRTQLRSLASKGIRLLKGPLEPFALGNLLSSAGGGGEMKAKAPVREDDVRCAYQKQLTSLVRALNQFEATSSQHRRSTPTEEALHQRLIELTDQARSIIERALDDTSEKVW